MTAAAAVSGLVPSVSGLPEVAVVVLNLVSLLVFAAEVSLPASQAVSDLASEQAVIIFVVLLLLEIVVLLLVIVVLLLVTVVQVAFFSVPAFLQFL